VDWGRVADGIGLAGFGVFFLLAASRGLPDGFWLDALSFWPVLLVSAGIRVIFERSPLPWGVVLGPVVVLGTLSWLAWGHPPEAAPPGEWREVSAARPEGVREVRLGVEGAGARVQLEARALAPATLATGRVASRGDRARLTETTDDHTLGLRLQGQAGGVVFLPGRKAAWELAVADDVPLDVHVDAIMSRSELDLRRAEVTSVRADEPFQVVVLRLPPPRKRVSVTLASPFCSFHLLVPDGTPVHLGDHFPISLVSRGPARDAPIADDEPGYDVTFGGPFGSLTIEEEPLPEGVGRRESADEPSPAASGPDDAEGARPPAEAPASPVPKRRPAEASPEADTPAAPGAGAPPRR
jgi:hypothetical protein